MKVDLTVGPTASFKIEGEDNIIKEIKSVVKDGVLKIYCEGNINPHKEIHVTLTTPSIDALGISGASTMSATGVKAKDLALDCSGASKLKMDGTADSVTLECSGASTADLKGLGNSALKGEVSGAATLSVDGSLGDVDMEASGASTLDFSNAKAKNAKIHLSGASNAKVIASGRIEAELSGASNLRYGGTSDVHIDGDEHGSSSERID